MNLNNYVSRKKTPFGRNGYGPLWNEEGNEFSDRYQLGEERGD